MSCKCGPNCLRRAGRRRECESCNRSRARSKAKARSVSGVQFDPSTISAANPRLKAAGRELGFDGGALGLFMQGATGYLNGKPEPQRETDYKTGWEWMRDNGEEAAD